jgi:hypothetical protein
MDGSLVMLIGVMFELMAERKGVYIWLVKQDCLKIHTFRDYFARNTFIGYRCSCQFPPYAVMYDADVLSDYLRNVIFKGTDLILARLMV